MSFTPVHFVPASQKDNILALPVTLIQAVPNKNTTHWCLYLNTGASDPVKIDCQPSCVVPSTVLPGGSKANIVISNLGYKTFNTAQTSFDLSVRSNLTVADVYNTLIEHGRHKYKFNSQGDGCQYWTNGQLDLLHQEGILADAQEVGSAKAGILKLGTEETPLTLDQGAYYE